MLLEGLSYDAGDVKELLALKAFRENRKIEYLKVMVQAHASVYAGQIVAAAMAQSGNSPDIGMVNKPLELLKEMLMPELAEEGAAKAERAKKLLEEELAKGSFQVEAMVFDKGKKKRKRNE